MKLVLSFVACMAIAVNAFIVPARRHAPPAAKDQATLEKEFAKLLTGATLVGSYTASDSQNVKKDRYEIVRAVKGPGDDWTITAKVEYKGFAVPMDIQVPVKWAGDTPVISITNQAIPGFGTFNARVLFYENQYVGTWSSAEHGGQMWGKIEHAPATQPAK